MFLKKIRLSALVMTACIMLAGTVFTGCSSTDTEEPPTEAVKSAGEATTTGWTDEEYEKEYAESNSYYKLMENKKVTVTKGEDIKDYPYARGFTIYPNVDYLVDENGRICCTLVCIVDGKYMCSDDTGAVAKRRWMDTDAGSMYFDENGYALTNQWISFGDVSYYVKDTGIMAADETLDIEGEQYTFDKSGKRVE